MGRRVLLSFCIAVAAVACGPAETQKQPAPTPNEAAPPPAPAAVPQRAPAAQLEKPAEKLWQAPVGEPAHGISMYGELRYPPDFQHFDYVNPDAPKGGLMRFGVAEATFDSFNPWIIKGNPADVGPVFDTLMVGSADEPFSEYGLLAKTVQTPADRSWVAFELRPEARWHDGQPVTADDVVWSFETLLAKGMPSYRFYYQSVAKVEKTGPLGVRFTFKPGTNRELPLILGQLPVLPKHWWASRNFEETSLEPPLGSGPYKVGKFEANRFVELERVPDYWGKDLPVNRGRNNFDVLHSDYYRDATVALEAFKGGHYDFRFENSAKDWSTGYDVPEVKDGRIVKESAPNQRPVGMQGFVMNLRRSLFSDRRVREALDLAFDFEWANKTLFYGQYTRTKSYFENSELASSGLPSADELAVLEPLRDKLPPEVFDHEYVSPKTDGSGDNRDNLRRAAELLQQAGWTAQNGKLVKDGKPFQFEFLVNSPLYERIALPYSKTLEKLGIAASVRTVDASQYRRRTDSFDYDMILSSFGESDSPGNEQRDYWGSEAAGRDGSRNAIGLKDPAIDALVGLLIASPDRKTLVTRTRALDRALLWGHYLVPNWYIGADRIAYWDKFGRPAVIPKNGVLVQLDAWWIDPAKAARFESR
jgi:microcin C transport system substrate-binding protein